MNSDFFSSFNTLDYIILLTLALSFLKGFLVGGVDKIFKIAGIVLTIYVALNYSASITSFIMEEFGIENKLLTMLAVLVVCASVIISTFHFLANKSTQVLKSLGLDIINRTIGAMLGVIIVSALWGGVFALVGKLNSGQEPKIIRESVVKNILSHTKDIYDLNIDALKGLPYSEPKTIIKQGLQESIIKN